MRRAKVKSSRALPWWLEADSEACPACSHGYAHRTETYCLDCDGPVCHICVQGTVTLELVCPSCFESRSRENEES